jgi:hypothetical protein
MTATVEASTEVVVFLVGLAFVAGLGVGAAIASHFAIRRAGHLMRWMRELIDELTIEGDRATAARQEWEREHHG